MPEMRKDPIVDRWVIIAESRAERPGAFLARRAARRPELRRSGLLVAADCPFCAGHESQTPPAVYERQNGNGRWTVRIVPNKFPAVSLGEELACGETTDWLPARGVHEVVVESPEHAIDMVELSRAQLACVLKAWRDRIAAHRTAGRWRFVLLFKNSGKEAGASLEHVHSQLVALPRVPHAIQQELEAAGAAYERSRACVFCRLIESERELASRVVIDGSGFLAVAALAGRQPYETWILPVEHQAAYDAARDEQLDTLAAVLAQVLQSLRATLPIYAYNLILHTAPFDTCWDDRYHWHIEIIPRISGLAGFELGAGEFINPVSPERAAGELNRNLAANDKLWLSE